MALVRYEPWDVISRLHDEINRVFETNRTDTDSSAATADWVPAVDIEESNDRFGLFVDLPGVNPDAVEITLEDGVLTITGEREKVTQEIEPTRRRAERGHGRFYRRFILPDTVDADGVSATGRNGVLEISIPKKAKAQARRIEVAA